MTPPVGCTITRAPADLAEWWPHPLPGEQDHQLAWQPGWASGGRGPRSPLGSGGDGVNDLHDAMQGGVRADGHVGATEVIVDGAHQPRDVQVRVGLSRAL